jgi:hypothetical protein
MAQRLTEAQVREEIGYSDLAGGRALRYPWAEWTDGNWWKIQKGSDYQIDTDNMRRGLATHAQRHSMKVDAYKRGDLLIFKFTDNG